MKRVTFNQNRIFERALTKALVNGYYLLIAATLLVAVSGARAGVSERVVITNFSELWSHIENNSPVLDAAEHTKQSATIQAQRSARHWFPRLYLEGQTYRTNDALLALGAQLGQRSVTAVDFAPAQLNRPGTQNFQHGVVGLDWAFFEGGFKTALAQAAKEEHLAAQLRQRAEKRQQFADAAGRYGALLLSDEQLRLLKNVHDGLERIVKQYRVGLKSNPVGYSGLLGMQSVLNRIEALRLQQETQQATNQALLQSHFFKSDFVGGVDWKIPQQSIADFVKQTLVYDDSKPGEKAPAVQAAWHGAFASQKAIDAEKARFLPRAGLFAQGHLINGARDTNTSYAGGLYLQWDLFQAQNLGAVAQAHHTAQAMEALAIATERQVASSKAATQHAWQSINKTLSLLDESERLLSEQVSTALVLFKNGSIHALQLAEVFARRVDLITQRNDVLMQLIRTGTNLYLASPETSGVATGEQHE